mmetsp:Transcript_104584/g.326157  ORF Transcript_104584/g.326157 Transcript_104584/m.326157 type:complete len:491 (+) Transcript_104584:1-1473(+)
MAIAPNADLLALGFAGVLQLHQLVRPTDISEIPLPQVELLQFSPRSNVIVACCGGRRLPYRISLIRTAPLGVPLSAPVPVPPHAGFRSEGSALQVVNTDGRDRAFLLLNRELCMFSDGLALVARADLSDSWACSLVATSSALAVGCPGRVLLLHAGGALSRFAERDLPCQAEHRGYFHARESMMLAYVESTDVIVAATGGRVYFLRSDLTVVRHIVHGGLSHLAVMPWQLVGRCCTGGGAEVWRRAAPEAQETAPLARSLEKVGDEWPRAVQLVEHAEPPAHISPEEATRTSDSLWASGIDALNAPRPATSVDRPRGVALLTFSRSSPALDEAVLASSPAQVARAAGVDVQPEWARGAKVLAAGLGPEHLEPAFLEKSMPRHVMLYDDDVDDLLDEPRGLPYEIRKVKPVGALPAQPGALSLAVASSVGASAEMGSASLTAAVADGSVASTAAPAPVSGQPSVLEVEVHHTFIDFRATSMDERLTRSAPP